MKWGVTERVQYIPEQAGNKSTYPIKLTKQVASHAVPGKITNVNAT